MNKIVILGGGFAGVESAIKLRSHGHDVTLISDRNYLFVYPVSIWIPTRQKTFKQVQISLPELQKKHGFELIIDKASRIDARERIVHLSQREITYDYLMIALGMHKLKTKGTEHTHSICGQPEEALKIRDELDKIIDKGEGKIAIGFGGNPVDSSASAVRGGPAFELLFNFSHYLKKKGLRDKVELTFFAPMKQPGIKLGQKPYKKMDVFFKHYRINKRIGIPIKEFEENAVVFGDGTRLESDLTIFIAAGDGHQVIKDSNLPINEAGFIKINELCRVQGHKNIYAIGDVAELTGPMWVSKQGHIAEVMADVASYNLHNEISGIGKRKSYWEKLHIVCLMDSGDGGAFIMRNHKKDLIIPLPILGHWMKKAWGFYYKNTKLKRIPRFPGM